MSSKRFETIPQFDKNLKKILRDSPQIEDMIWEAIELFLDDRTNPTLRDHALKGSQFGFCSFSISFDLRIVYREAKDLYIFTNIGSHSEVYKR